MTSFDSNDVLRIAETSWPRCAHCGDRLGVYEPLVWVRPDGRTVPCGLLKARADPLSAAGSRLLHETCHEG